MSETGLGVYIPDPSHDGLDAFRKSLEAEYGVPFRFVSIGRGAALAAFVADLVSFAESPGGLIAGGLLSAFFAGEKIEKTTPGKGSISALDPHSTTTQPSTERGPRYLL